MALNYVYQYKDHLGNVRLSYKNTSTIGVNLQIVEENNYYPFGLEHKGYGPASTSNHPYKFGGKEFNEELGLDWYDVSARNYDPALGRWMNIDPLAELMRRHSPYNYAFDNPILFLDPDGMQIDISDIFENSENLANGIQLLLDLSELTGLSLSYNSSGGKLDYLKNEDGSAVTNYADGVTLGSNTARNLLTDSIDDESVIKVERKDLYGSNFTPSTNTMKLDYRQIDSQSSTTSSGLYHKTAGYGMTFLHELGHADSNGNLKDTNGSNFGGNMIQMNKIRSELDVNPLNRVLSGGDQFGQRASYTGSYAINPNDKLAGNLYDTKARVKFTILNSRGKKKNKGLITRKNQIINTN
ncbi:RHS repeat-associated core domain-containing protein [Nonlabens sp.]|uniref:RHS repeat domain-containing protein n=1 Tax=Nonlabens sp. TaxID=1888209 RepID=UPI0032641291